MPADGRMALRDVRCAAHVLALAGLAAAHQPAFADRATQARVCRSILPVVNARGARLKVVATNAVGQSDAISINYDATAPNAARTINRKLICAFTQRRGGAEELMLVSSDGRILGVPRLTFLKRFYLRSSEAAAADTAIELPAYELQRPSRQP